MGIVQMLVIPPGIINEYHESPTYNGVERHPIVFCIYKESFLKLIKIYILNLLDVFLS